MNTMLPAREPGQSWPHYTQDLLRLDLAQLHDAAAEDLPPVAYAHDGPHWAEWLLEALPAPDHIITLEDTQFLLTMLRSDVKSQILAGNLPSPELRARMLIWAHGADDALMAFVQPAWNAGEFPERNVTWLLLHPERIPKNFPMFRVGTH